MGCLSINKALSPPPAKPGEKRLPICPARGIHSFLKAAASCCRSPSNLSSAIFMHKRIPEPQLDRATASCCGHSGQRKLCKEIFCRIQVSLPIFAQNPCSSEAGGAQPGFPQRAAGAGTSPDSSGLRSKPSRDPNLPQHLWPRAKVPDGAHGGPTPRRCRRLMWGEG